MVNEVNLALYFICHHGHYDSFRRDVRFVKEVTLRGHVPVTYFFSGIQIDEMEKHHGSLACENGLDVLWAMRGGDFINPQFGYNSPYLSEIGIMPYNHIPLVQPWQQDIWHNYLWGILADQVKWSRGLAERVFDKTPVSIHPPDGIYAPASANALKTLGLDNVVVSSEYLGGDKSAKGVVYYGSGLNHVMRTNDIHLPAFRGRPGEFVEAVENYAQATGRGFVVVGCDIDEVDGKRGMSLEEGIWFVREIGNQVFGRHGRMRMININAAAHWNFVHQPIEWVWGWNDVHAMIYGDGSLGFIDGERNGAVSHVNHLIADRYHRGWDGGTIKAAKASLWEAADAACRNTWCCYDPWITSHFWGNINYARHLLQG